MRCGRVVSALPFGEDLRVGGRETGGHFLFRSKSALMPAPKPRMRYCIPIGTRFRQTGHWYVSLEELNLSTRCILLRPESPLSSSWNR